MSLRPPCQQSQLSQAQFHSTHITSWIFSNALCYAISDSTKGGSLAQASLSQSLCALHEPPHIDVQPHSSPTPYSFVSEGSWSAAPPYCDVASVCMNVTCQQHIHDIQASPFIRCQMLILSFPDATWPIRKGRRRALLSVNAFA